MLKKILIYVLLGIITESAKTLIIALYSGDSYEFVLLKFVFNIVAFTLFYSTVPFTVHTIQSWHKKSLTEKSCVICQFISACMIIGIIISRAVSIILIYEVGISVICVVMVGLVAVSLIMKKNKIIVFTSIKWIIMLLIAGYIMFNSGVITEI